MKSKKQAVNVLIVEMGSLQNKGNWAILEGTLKVLKEYVPDAKFKVMSHGPPEEFPLFPVEALPAVVNAPRGSKAAKLFRTGWELAQGVLASMMALFWKRSHSRFFVNHFGLKEYVDADVIIVRGSDAALSDIYGLDSLLIFCFSVLPGIILSKKIVVFGHSIGPFRSKVSKLLAQFVLNRVHMITLRERVSGIVLKSLNVANPNISITGDLAFAIEPASESVVNAILEKECVCEKRPFVGLSVSRVISRWLTHRQSQEPYQDYVHMMAKVVEYINRELGATVLIVPHVVGPERSDDDRIVAEDIISCLADKKNTYAIRGDYTPSELRGIISRCDIFIGTRMHAVISALSVHVPSLAISYVHKTKGILEAANQSRWVCKIQNITYEGLVEKVAELWREKEQIRLHLSRQMPKVRNQALANGLLVQKLIEEQKCL